ncbi:MULTISPECIES: alanine/glycine:cation symporter family protein [unclassified Sedimentibacter]|uniref:alanine/glycine:cation symporter family protein n=1 Tax=unclassified Sedimentibacter TaxID=2649220 RepID=UPI0027E11488|nr:alanine/glycine:cation symporter family protein [Sedimentibacter sp. MB35-C1]WMJ76624.1 alanine/glycine:cation symporter family protein [Sedimentibacter sp. MB35-C1]
MLNTLNSVVNWANGYIWGIGMLLLIGGAGIYFTVKLGFFQFVRFKDMWSRIIEKGDSESGISSFASFCTTMAMRVGTGNVAGVAVAIYSGGPGALFWMILIGMTNSAVCFAECTLGQLYKIRVDGAYRGGGPYCAERGLGWGKYGKFMAVVMFVGTSCFMTAAATYTVSDAFNQATGISMTVISACIAVLLLVTVLGGIRRISTVASSIVPFMTAIYMGITLIILVLNITKIPALISDVISSAFGLNAIFGGTIGIAIQQGIKRGTFSSASGMGEASPTAAAVETSHPVKQGLSNAAGVWLDTVIVCSCTGLMILLTDSFNTAGGYIGSGSPELAEGITGGIIYVQMAASTVLGNFGHIFIAIMLLLFSFTCLISYYYEAETAAMYLFQKPTQQNTRKAITRILQFGMPVLVFLWGIIESDTAWGLSDFALGACTWINMLVVCMLFPKCVALYKDYDQQMKAGKDPYYDPDKLSWKGVDVEMWKDINAKRIKAKNNSL